MCVSQALYPPVLGTRGARSRRRVAVLVRVLAGVSPPWGLARERGPRSRISPPQAPSTRRVQVTKYEQTQPTARSSPSAPRRAAPRQLSKPTATRRWSFYHSRPAISMTKSRRVEKLVVVSEASPPGHRPPTTPATAPTPPRATRETYKTRRTASRWRPSRPKNRRPPAPRAPGRWQIRW